MIFLYLFLTFFILKFIKKLNEYNIDKVQKIKNKAQNFINQEIIKKNKEKKIYKFINLGNNCYLISSLYLLTRIKDLKDKILNFNNICKDSITKGKLIKEFKDIFYKIDNGLNEISPEKLKNIMGEIDKKYYQHNQEDVNEFMSYFLNAIYGETSNKNLEIEKLEIDDIENMDKKAYENYYTKFNKRNGYSFMQDLFYGILRTENNCKNCGNITVKFSAYNMLELSIYELVNQNESLTLDKILKKYISEVKNEYLECIYCHKKEIYIKTSVYTSPKYLIIFFARIIGDEYIYNNIDYPKTFNLKNYFNNIYKNNKYSNYILDCVIEHSGGVHYGHYTSLCQIDKNKECWYRFNDNYSNKYNNHYQSKNAIILLYKSIDI